MGMNLYMLFKMLFFYNLYEGCFKFYIDVIPMAHDECSSERFSLSYFSAMVAVLMGDKYSKNQQRLVEEVERFSLFSHLIFEESAHLSLIPAPLAAFFKIPAWKRFVLAVDESLTVGKTLILVCNGRQ
jgi:predicted component of type VI protein secretion system